MPDVDKNAASLRTRAVRMVSEVRQKAGLNNAAVVAVAGRLGLDPPTVTAWVAQAEAGLQENAGGPQVDLLRRRLRDLQAENEILRAASGFFAREPVRPRRP